MLRNMLICLLAALLITTACGCTHSISGSFADSEPSAASDLTVEPEATAETSIPLLDISAGSHLLTYTDEATGDYLDYYLFVPEQATASMPLIIFLHGDGEVGKINKLEDYGLISQARTLYGENFPFIAISPCTRVESWTSGYVPGTLKGLIDQVVIDCRIDIEHIIITGHSRGADGTWYMANNHPEFFSAVVPISCPNLKKLDVNNFINTPVRAFVGTDGELENYYKFYMNLTVNQINEAGGDAELTILEDCNHNEMATAAYTLELFQWMIAQ